MAIPRKISLLEEWQFTIPRGSRKTKSIPRGPRGISRNLEVKKIRYGAVHKRLFRGEMIFFLQTKLF